MSYRFAAAMIEWLAMIRVPIAFSILLLATPATATDSMGTYQELTRVVQTRSDCLAAANPDEIVVCGRKQQNLRYRLPLPSAPTPGSRAARTVNGERFALQQYRAEGGSGSCTAVGPNGLFGCTSYELRVDEEEDAGRTPGLVRRFLTYLDPGE